MNTLIAGAKAPLFTLQDQKDNPVSLQECLKKGPVLVYFTLRLQPQAAQCKPAVYVIAKLNSTVTK